MISYYLPSGSKIGVGHQVHALANELSDRGHEVTVFSACQQTVGARYQHELVELSGHLRTFRFAIALRRKDFSSFDVLHAHGDDYWMWRRRARVHVRTLHGSCFDEALHIRGFVERLRMILLGFSEVLASIVADQTAVVSPATRRWTPWVRTVVPNGVDLRRLYPDGQRTERPSVLFVGTWSGRKRGSLLAEVFVEQVLPKVPDAQLLMVSTDVPVEHHPAIRVLGRVGDDELADLYRRMHVLCLPSSYEGFGIPYVEAMASGLPVVATPNLGARYVTDEGRAGVLAETHQLGAALVELLTDPARRAELARRGLERAQTFALTNVADAYERLYLSAMRARS